MRIEAAGIDGPIVVDLPPEEDGEPCIPAQAARLNSIRLATPTADDERLPKVLTNTSGFVSYASIAGAADGTVVSSAIVDRIGGGDSVADVLAVVKGLADGAHRA